MASIVFLFQFWRATIFLKIFFRVEVKVLALNRGFLFPERSKVFLLALVPYQIEEILFGRVTTLAVWTLKFIFFSFKSTKYRLRMTKTGDRFIPPEKTNSGLHSPVEYKFSWPARKTPAGGRLCSTSHFNNYSVCYLFIYFWGALPIPCKCCETG